MRRSIGLAVAAAMTLLGASQALAQSPARDVRSTGRPARAATSAVDSADAGPNYIFAGGGTPLTNGIFFPGTTICDDSGCTGEPLQIEQGTDVTFANLDQALVATGHRIVSQKRKKRGKKKPLFASKLLTQPGETDRVITSNLKPGTYLYYCAVHFGMYGQIEVVKP